MGGGWPTMYWKGLGIGTFQTPPWGKCSLEELKLVDITFEWLDMILNDVIFFLIDCGGMWRKWGSGERRVLWFFADDRPFKKLPSDPVASPRKYPSRNQAEQRGEDRLGASEDSGFPSN
jgi:hypothetical protein